MMVSLVFSLFLNGDEAIMSVFIAFISEHTHDGSIF